MPASIHPAEIAPSGLAFLIADMRDQERDALAELITAQLIACVGQDEATTLIERAVAAHEAFCAVLFAK